ncbi:MAG: PRC-barrel domain-containing protein [Alphaproteobacteria bacterium]
MKFFLAAIIAISVGLINPITTFAASSMDVIAFQAQMGELNRLKPLQNPRNEAAKDILKRTVIDRENKVVGEINDVLINDKAQVSSIFAVFDRLQFTDGVYLNYQTLNVTNSSNGYKLGLNADEVVSSYPELLANIETASGGESGIVSAKSILGREVIGSNGIKIGRISEILFDQGGAYVRGIYVNVDYRAIRNRGVAVPFSAFKFTKQYGRLVASIDQDYADAIVLYAKDNL